MTILAEGWVDVQGGAKMTARLGAAPGLPVVGIGPITIVTARDLEMSGNTGGVANTYYGLFYARHQVQITGSPTIRGQVIALNEADTAWPTVAPIAQVNPSNLVMLDAGFMKISGTPNIEYDGDGLAGVTWTVLARVPLQPGEPESA